MNSYSIDANGCFCDKKMIQICVVVSKNIIKKLWSRR